MLLEEEAFVGLIPVRHVLWSSPADNPQ